jgi:hypothetical protein
MLCELVIIFTCICTHEYKYTEKILLLSSLFFFLCLTFIYLLLIYLFTCAYIVWVISPPCPLSHPSPPTPPEFQAGPVLFLSLILLKKLHMHNKKDKVFLLVELRIAIQKDSYYCFHVSMNYDPC